MEWVNTLLSLGFTPLNLILGGMLYLVLANQGAVPKLWARDDEDKQVPPWASQLLQYFNHDTTDYHKKTHAFLEKMVEKMDSHNEMEKENHSKLEEILKYGVPCREKK